MDSLSVLSNSLRIGGKGRQLRPPYADHHVRYFLRFLFVAMPGTVSPVCLSLDQEGVYKIGAVAACRGLITGFPIIF